MLYRVSYRGGGGGETWEIPPQRPVSPPPPKILATILINTCRYNKNVVYRFIRLFDSLKISRISLKLTKFSRGPSIAILIRRVRFKSDKRFRSLVLIIFIWLNDLSTVAVPTGSVSMMFIRQ